MKGAIQSVDVSYLVHATEGQERIWEAVAGLFGFGDEPAAEEMEGHYGNRITRVSYHATGEEAGAVFERLMGSLSLKVREELSRTLVDLVDEHSALYLRLDKQTLMAGRVSLESADPVRVKVKPRLFALKGSANEFYRGALHR